MGAGKLYNIGFLSSQRISGGTVTCDTVLFNNTGCRIIRTGNDLEFYAIDDFELSPKDDVFIKVEAGGSTTTYAKFDGGLMRFSINEYGPDIITPQYTVHVSGNLYATTVSSQIISGGSLKLGETTVTTILDEDSMTSDSATALTTQQSVKAYIDTISGNLAGGLTDTPSTWSDMTTGTGLTPITVGVSGSAGTTVNVLGYSTISSQAKEGGDFSDSGVKYTWVYDSMIASGVNYSTAYTHSQDTSQAHSDYLLNSGDDDTSGTLTAKSFVGPISSTAISGETIRFTTFIGGTDATAAEIEELTDSSETTLHSHAAGTDVAWSGAAGYITVSGNSRDSYNFTSTSGTRLGNLLASGNEYTSAYDSGQRVMDLFDESLFATSANVVSRFADSSNINTRFIASGGISSPYSGQVLTYSADLSNHSWQNVIPPMNFNVANVRLLSGQNLNLVRMKTGVGKKIYAWQAACANSSNASVSGLKIEILSGSTSKYNTSSNIIQQGYPLTSFEGDVEIRIMYSGSNRYGEQQTQLEYATGFMSVSVY